MLKKKKKKKKKKRKKEKDHAAPLVGGYTLKPSFFLIFSPFHGLLPPQTTVHSFPLSLAGFPRGLPHRRRTSLLLASLRRGFLSPPRPLFALRLTTGVHVPRRTNSSSGGLLVAPSEPRPPPSAVGATSSL